MSTTLQRIEPIARFHALYSALAGDERLWPSDSAWLRYAAQSAVLRPAGPDDTARAIREAAEQLHRSARWFDALGSSLAFVVAAQLVQSGIPTGDFLERLRDAKRRFRAVGLPRGGVHELKAILVLAILSDGAPVTATVASRMARLLAALKRRHWWLTGRDDLPSCAMLSGCAGTSDEIAAAADDLYDHLRADGFARGDHLQTASHVLLLTDRRAKDTLARFEALARAFDDTERVWSEEYEALAMLTLLDHEPLRIASLVQEIASQLDQMRPMLTGPVDFNVAADLAFLDLVRFDRRMRPLTRPAETEAVRGLIRKQRAASILLAQVPPTPSGYDALEWPLG